MAGGFALAFAPLTSASILPTLVLNDSLNSGSTINGTNSPTATSTNYDIASSKDGIGSSLTSGDLAIVCPSTSSGISEAQAIFTPVSLVNTGDAVELTVTFTDKAGLLSSASSSGSVDIALDYAAGSGPYNTMNNGNSGHSGLSSGQTNDATGGVQNWQGYEIDAFQGQSSKVYTRAAQTGGSPTNLDQGLITNQTGGPVNPASTALAGGNYVSEGGSTGSLTVNQQYTDELLITLGSGGTYDLSAALYQGANDSGTQVGTTTLSTFSLPTLPSFGGFAIGFRNSASVNEEMDVNQVIVSTTVTVPEPASIGLLSFVGLGLMHRRRRA